ncbi:hypothetical protein L2E82_02741 [Cichorium intybus]|uniref:Uncharacterized protein n=1 Tax=Cichorium intybus TaxID=13427 RepID=A0ACB9H2M5_CICIN|nr:hypothetical protein L2E82_02741 [Cichorium intybus]
MDESVRSFLYECLKRGCFPIVMNPRGCARSPITTPRLFTAADSDDICTTVQFVNRARPWTTLMGVGFGYGANMLTKYLAEVGEETPLTAATCLDNPFDLKEATKYPNHLYNLTDGLIDMLKSNKELFQGRAKGFDVDKALQAKSLKDFEEAISMVSYGCDSIEEFYINSSTKDVIGNIKIPLLFIQNDAMPYFSTPRGLIAQNPYTSLLTCTFQSNDIINTGTSNVSWCQHLVVEWLTSVELGLLKGRHPLLEDTDVTINPSKRFKLMTSKPSQTKNLHQLEVNTSHPSKKILKRNDANALDLQIPEGKDKEPNMITNGTVTQTKLVDTEVVKEDDVDLTESERGQMLQATEVVMNMLDVTMPEALSEERKQKVMTAIGQGETLMNALQGAVPEDVRGKLTSAVTGILENQKKNLNGLSSISKIPDATSALNTKIQEKVSSPEKEPNTSLPDDSHNHPSKTDAPSNVEEPKAHSDKSHEELGSDNSKEKTVTETSSKVETSGSSEEQVSEPVKLEHEGETKEKDSQQKEETNSQDNEQKGETKEKDSKQKEESNAQDNEQKGETKEKDSQQKEETNVQDNEQKVVPTPKTEENSSSSPENQSVVKEDGENQKKEESIPQPVPSNTTSNSPSFGVSQALDAFTGMDDSTQLAVNSVFSVIEDVITQLEGKNDDDSPIDDKNKVDDSAIGDKNKVDDTSTDSESNKKSKPEVDNQNSITKLPYKKPHLLSNTKSDKKSLDSDDTSALFLDYVPEEGQWKLIGQSADGISHDDDDDDDDDDVIEPAYVILDAESDSEKESGDDSSMVLMQLVKKNILNSLKVEVCRRIDATDMEDIAPTLRKELENVANVISVAVVKEKEYIISWDGDDLFGPGNLHAERILDAITSVVQGTRYMKKIIPVGIVVGSSLASLRKVFNIAAADHVGSAVRDEVNDSKVNQNKEFDSEDDEYEEEDISSSLGSDTVMVGAVTAALGASALLVHQQDSYGGALESSLSSLSFRQKENHQERGKLEEETSKSSDQNIVTSLAEKAMLVAGPVMPTKEGGEVDQDRLVAMLAEIGQRGGMLRLVGKLALLWGGLRGAMSLIGKLISFLHLSDRPLYQRILGFVSLVLVLWTPVVVPLLPTLVQNWASHNSSGFAELACIIGLYSSIVVLVVLWGKRIRGYEDPLERYGIKFTSTKQIKNLLLGVVGGVTLVSLIQFTNASLGFVSISWSTTAPSSTDPVTLLKFSGGILRYLSQGLITAIVVSLVEELLFRSWLTEEITVDLGFHRGIILSGLAFSVSQWSLNAIPGLWLLSLGLAGARQKSQGSLSLPIGLRAGIMASSYVLKEGGFLIFKPNYPSWVISGGDAFQPFNSIVGLVFALSWAVILYPKTPRKEKINEEIEETPPQ